MTCTMRWNLALAGACLLATSACTAHASAATARETVPASRHVLQDVAVDGLRVHELSGLAWDSDERLLYAVSDRGRVFRFRLKLAGDRIVAVEPVFAATMVDGDGGAPRKGYNAEGLALRNAGNGKSGDTELVVALESKPPRIARFGPSGVELGALPVPPPADDLANYRKKGRGLESVAIHPTYGLMTAPESPLRAQPDDQHALYARGRHWSFARHAPDSRLKALAVLADGNVLVLERSRDGAKDSMIASVRLVNLEGCPEGGVCETRTLAVLAAGPDNFEGMAVVDARHILLVSDDGGDTALGTVFVLLAHP